MERIFVDLEAKSLLPTLDVYRQYFDSKYPCTDESNDGSNMPLEDEIKFETYNYLLRVYEKSKSIFDNEYKKMKETIQIINP